MNGPRLEDSAMTTKQIKGCLLALSAVFLLSGCDAIEAKPTNYDDAIVQQGGKDADLYQNTMGEIWDAITSSKNDRILEEFLKIITKDQFGSYSEIKEAVASEATAKAFIQKHKIYIRDNDADLATKFAGMNADKVQFERLKEFKKDLDKRINEAFYNEIKSGSYTKDNIFYEERLAWAHYTELYEIDVKNHDDWIKSYLTPELKKEDVSSFIHLDDGRYDDYINRKILPTILKDKLVEEYIYENNYTTLGRAYARNVNVIKLTREEKYESVPRNMMEKYVETRVDVANPTINFEDLANAWRGFSGLTADGRIADPENPTQPAQSSDTVCNILSNAEEVIAKAGGLETGVATIKSTGGTEQKIVYYKNTKLGILLEKYNKITAAAESNRWVDEETANAISEFTNSNAYPKEVGLRNKLAELAVTDYTTDGWYVKNGSLDLPETLKSRLFNITVSNNVDKLDPESATVKYDKKNYVRNIQGHYFLTPATSDKEAKYNYVINDSDNYYLVEVLEAPATSKLKMDINSETSYINLKNDKGALFTETVAMEIAKVLGTKESYVNNAYQSYIEKYSLEYHDQALYDFFKEKFPDLFEDK